MDLEAEKKIRLELGQNENILWTGRPKQGLLLRISDVFLIPFSLLWGGFAIFWEYSAYRAGAPLFFLLFGAVFVLVGLYVIIGRFFVDALTRAQTYYGVTNNRIVILTELFGRKLKALDLKTLTNISFTQKKNGEGTLTFGATHPLASRFGGVQWPGMERYQGPQFDLIQNVRSVYDIIRQAQQDAE